MYLYSWCCVGLVVLVVQTKDPFMLSGTFLWERPTPCARQAMLRGIYTRLERPCGVSGGDGALPVGRALRGILQQGAWVVGAGDVSFEVSLWLSDNPVLDT